MMFTGKYGNMNFRIKIAYYPTFPREHHTKHDSQHLYGGRVMHKPPEVNDPRTNTEDSDSPDEATERMRAVSVQIVCHEIEV